MEEGANHTNPSTLAVVAMTTAPFTSEEKLLISYLVQNCASVRAGSLTALTGGENVRVCVRLSSDTTVRMMK